MIRSIRRQILPMWVKCGVIKEVTGWEKEKMRRAREQGLIVWRHTKENGFQYDLNSIHPALLKSNVNA